MLLNEKPFFDVVRAGLGRLNQEQVDGFHAILYAWVDHYHEQTSVPQFAVVLGTAWHETGHTMHPIREFGNRAYFTRLYGVEGQNPKRAREMGNTQPGDGVKFNGKGYVQLTWRANYQKATKRLRDLGLIGKDIDFDRDPDFVMQPKYALPIMFIGMEEGWFTGRKLDAIVDDKVDGNEESQFIASRKIINGADRDKLIAGYAMTFLRALIASVDMKAPKLKPAEIKPAQPVNVVSGATFWNRFWSAAADLVKH